MTAHRASLLGLLGLVFFLCAAAVSCSLETSGFGGETEDVCTAAVHCDDANACTVDACGNDGVCTHEPVADGIVPDGVSGNCMALGCEGGVQTPVPLMEDVDDGNPCTEDSCDETMGAVHTVIIGLPCEADGGLSTCDPDGNCPTPQCGHLDESGEEVGCPANPNGCSISYCNKSSGKCVLDKLDGVPLPNTVPGQCGGTYCVAGEEVAQYADAGAPCTGLTPLGNPAKVCNGTGECVACNENADCNPLDITISFCFGATCDASSECNVTMQPDGTHLPSDQQVAGDCLRKECLNLEVVDVPQDNDLPNDMNLCTNDSCANGVKTFVPVAPDTPCGANLDLVCNETGVCVGCNDPIQCGTATECHQFACISEQCTDVFPIDGFPLTPGAQVAGDCLLLVCDGVGGVKPMAKDDDLPNDNNDCTLNQCQAGTPVFPFVPVGSVCNGNRICNATGQCLGGTCATGMDCPPGSFCVDGLCCNAACNGVCEACTTAQKGTGLNGDCGVSMAGAEGPGDSDCPGPKLCDGTTGAAACKYPTGQPCSIGMECLSGQCTDGVCCNNACNGVCQVCNAPGTVGTCTNIPFGQDPADECPGAVNCNGTAACGNLFGLGTACSAAAECASGNCIDGVCCNNTCTGNCQACNLTGNMGTCSNIAQGQDPAGECSGALVCNGAGLCKSPNGTTCAAASDCASGFCADGVCCNNACTGNCQACNLSGNMGTCTPIPSGQDPAGECPGAQVCNGSGTCTGGPNGAACGAGNQCASGNCVDGVCCNTACSGLCRACNVSGSVGTCTNFAAGTDAFDECAMAMVCNGNGACTTGPNGAACNNNSQCTSGSCVDGVCCNNACTSTCQACNIAGSVGTCSSYAAMTDPAGECPGTTTCNGATACNLLAQGAVCTLDGECSSGFCRDGFCCNATCGTCLACSTAKTGQANGTCANVTANTDPDNECSAECNGMGACEAANGASCTMASQCASGHCVDGACCSVGTCPGTCMSCNPAQTVSGMNGACDFVKPDTDPANECSGNGQVDCNGAGECEDPQGTACTLDSQCTTGECVDGYCCESACDGNCEACDLPGGEGLCMFIPVDTDPDNECTGAQVCDGVNQCVDGPPGSPCPMTGMDTNCEGGWCADGVCCASSCQGNCEACDLAGTEGTCTFIPDNTDPDDECDDVGAPNCNGSGVCE